MPAQSNPWGFNFRATSGYLSDPSNTTYVLGSTTFPTSRAIGADTVPFGLGSACSARDRSTTAAGGRLGGFIFRESAGAGSEDFIVTLCSNGVWTIGLGRADITEGQRKLGKVEIYDNTTLLHTVVAHEQSPGELATDAENTDFATAAAWLAGQVPVELEFTSTTIKIRCYWDFGAGEEFWLSHVVLTQLSVGEPLIRLYRNGVEHDGGDDGTGAGLLACDALCVDGDVITIQKGKTITLDTPARLTNKAVEWRCEDIDTIHAGGAAVGPVTLAKRAQVVKITTPAESTADPIWDMVNGVNGRRWTGIWLADARTAGNTSIATLPIEAHDGSTPEADALTLADMPDNLLFDRCYLPEKVYTTGSFFGIRHDGKGIRLRDCYGQNSYSTGNQGDGYIFHNNVGPGPLNVERIDLLDIGGEVMGGASHGWDGGGNPALPPPYPELWGAQVIPNGAGATYSGARVRRTVSKRALCYSPSAATAIGTGSKTLTVPPAAAMAFVNGEAVTATGGAVTGTSTSSVAIGTGTKTFTTQASKAWTVGDAITATASGGTMTGTISAYSGTTLEINVASVTGSGTHASWSFVTALSITGTVTSQVGTTLTIDVASKQGSGTPAGWSVDRTAVPQLWKNDLEFCMGQDLVLNGWFIDRFWHDSGSQWSALIFKLSTLGREELDYIPLRRITIKNSIIRSIAQLLTILRPSEVNAANPHITDILLEDCLVYDVDILKWGFPGNGGVIYLGTDMPTRVWFKHVTLDCAVNMPSSGLVFIGDAASQHPTIDSLDDFRAQSNLLLLPGNHTLDFFGYMGTAPTGVATPAAFLAKCTDPRVTANSWVTSDAMDWGAYEAQNTLYRGTAGRTALLAKLRDPATASLDDRDYRYLEGQEEYGHDGRVRGCDHYRIYRAVGAWAWPLNYVPDPIGVESPGQRARHRYRFAA